MSPANAVMCQQSLHSDTTLRFVRHLHLLGSKMSKTIISLGVALLSLSGNAHADVASKQSQCCLIVVGGSEAPYANDLEGAGVPAVGVSAYDGGARITFNDLKALTSADKNGVSRINTSTPSAKGALGDFNFKQVSNQQVYFGEWSQEGLKNDPSRSVYYAGDSSGRVIPTTPVTYAVQGISNYSGANLMSGELTATFGSAVSGLTGSLANNSLKVEINAINNGVWFDGGAKAIDPATNALLSSGWTKGSFFGAGKTASLAGIAYFSNRDFDVAFGGVKK